MSEYVCMLLSIIWVFFQITTGACPDDVYGLDCSYTCHCTSGCDDVRGCSGNCKMGWSGPKCTINNAALNKNAYQSSYYDKRLSASNGVDGDYTIGILTDIPQQYTWWEVDLGEEHYIHDVTIHFRNDGFNYRRNGVEVYTSLQLNQTNRGQLCGKATINSPDVTRMTCDHVARYVTLYQETNNDHGAGTAMDFKQVEVFICDAGTFGSDCTAFCHCQDKPCDYSTGQCAAGCQHNWTGQHCDVCDTNHYGLLCSDVCYDRHCDETNGKSTCNGITGQCVNGCDPGWTGVDCTQKCPSGSYGKDCKRRCSKRRCYGNSGCGHVTGKCVNGCDRGYESLDCTKQCSGSYGFNCNMSCTSRKCYGSTGCDPSYGNCTDGCMDGFELPDCVQECRSGTFGARCRLKCGDRRCHGDNTTCDAVSGTCQHGCNPGWKTHSCLKPCDAGRYGDGCASDCINRHCLNKAASCDHVTGSCDGPCEESWKGVDCTGCDGKYGKDCRYSCRDRKCRDTSAPCDYVTGSCKGKCQDGWQGDTCTTQCSGTYGQDCKSSCDGRHCKDNTVCDHITGACSGPCLTGWQGDACVTAVASEWDNGSTITAMAAVIGVLCILLVAVSVYLFCYVRRHRLTSASRSEKPAAVENQDGGHYEIVDRERNNARGNVSAEISVVNSPRSRDPGSIQQRRESAYVNVGQDIQLNEYEHLDMSESPQNDYDKIGKH